MTLKCQKQNEAVSMLTNSTLIPISKPQASTPQLPSPQQTATTYTMTVTEAVKSAVGLSSSPPRSSPVFPLPIGAANEAIAATREQMRDAKLPIQYRDSCANLLIPLNRCRYEEYYLPWKCEVSLCPLGLVWTWDRSGWGLVWG